MRLRETLTIFASQIRERCKNDDGKVKKSQRTCNDNADQARESGWYIKSNLSKKVRVSKRAGERVKADEWSGKKRITKLATKLDAKPRTVFKSASQCGEVREVICSLFETFGITTTNAQPIVLLSLLIQRRLK